MIISFVAACSEQSEDPNPTSVNAKSIDLNTMPWTEDRSPISVSLYDLSGNKIGSAKMVQDNQEYEVVLHIE